MQHATLRRNRERQRELYGEPLGVCARRAMAVLRITQARLAEVLGLSPSMLSQLISGRRVKIANPVVLRRLMLLDHRVVAMPAHPGAADVRELLMEVRSVRVGSVERSAQALRSAAEPAQLTAAAAVLAAEFPALAEVLRRAATG